MMKLQNKVAKKIILSILSIFIVVTVLFSICYNPIMLRNNFKDDWALYNYGQTINGNKGTSGIDIDLVPAIDVADNVCDIKIAIIDTGVDTNNTVFSQCNIDNGYDFYNDDNSIFDSYLHDYHGTYIASTIAKIVPKATILPIKFMEGTSGSIDNAVASIEYAINQGAKIINCSWNFYEYNEGLYNIIKCNPDVLFVCAAGNYSVNIDEVDIYPCKYNLKNILNVMAIDNNGIRYKASGYGEKSVHIAAPGVAAKAILPGNDITLIDGTSVATAYVSAASAILLSINNNLKPEEIINCIVESSNKTTDLFDSCISEGILDINESIKFLNNK